MKYICFGYLDVARWSTLSQDTQLAMIDACIAYDESLKRDGHWAGGEGLQGPETAVMLRYGNGQVSVTDGPYAETKEMLGGILMLEARDLNHAIQLLSHHPGVKMGPWEIRPVEDMSQMIRESEARRAAAK